MMAGEFPSRLARGLPLRRLAAVSAVAVAAFACRSAPAQAVSNEQISHAADAIHQEVEFNASPARVYEALTSSRRFAGVVALSAAMKSGIKLGSQPVSVSRQVGGTFTLFGGHILGRQIDLVPGKRIVQAWRVANWDAGVYSIARFELVAQGSGTKLVFDHTGFPSGEAEHLAEGWRSNYWEPLAKVLASEAPPPVKQGAR